jgi:uncharacterized protein YbgA (DUF1722 family)
VNTSVPYLYTPYLCTPYLYIYTIKLLAILREVREADTEANVQLQFDDLFDYTVEKVTEEGRSFNEILGRYRIGVVCVHMKHNY